MSLYSKIDLDVAKLVKNGQKMTKFGENVVYQYIWKYQDSDANFWYYYPIFNPAWLEYDTFKDLK